MIVILAGRRTDAPDAETPRFPLGNAATVAEKLEQEFIRLKPHLLISSAACGADLIALKVAKNLGIRRRIVLPFEAARFREKSVTDRPGNEIWNWGKLFDELYQEASERSDAVVIKPAGTDDTDAFKAANAKIFEEAKTLMANTSSEGLEGIAAIVVWEGCSRGEDDLTMEFAERARAESWPLISILTINEDGGGV